MVVVGKEVEEEEEGLAVAADVGEAGGGTVAHTVEEAVADTDAAAAAGAETVHFATD